jgi:hypothetical protein
VAKDAHIHHVRLLANDGLEIHLRENIALYVDAGGDLPQFDKD